MKLIFIIVLICFTEIVSAQQKSFNYTVSPPYKVIDGYPKYYFADKENKHVLMVKFGRRDIFIQRFDANTMKEVLVKKHKKNREQILQKITVIDGKVHYFYTMWDKQRKMHQLWVQEIDSENCTFSTKRKKLIEVNEHVKFSFIFSQNQTRLLIKYRKRPEKVRDAVNFDKIGMHIFDESLELITSNEIKMPYTEKQMDNIDYHIDQEGNAYVLARVRPDGSNKNYIGKGRNKTINYQIELLKVNVKKNNVKISKIELEQYGINTIYLYDGFDNNMICAGFYNNVKNNTGNADGLFLFKVDEEGIITDKKFYEIPVEILNQYKKARVQEINKKKDEKGKAEFSSLVLRNIHIQEDNSIIIVGEQYFVRTHTFTDANGNTSTRYSYHFYDILVSKISPEGNLEWMRKLPKRQISGSPYGGCGFRYMTIKDKHYFVFLDNVKNMELKLDQYPAVHSDGKGGYLTSYSINNDGGKVDKISILNTRDIKGGYKVFQFYTARILPISDNEFVTEFYKKKKQDIMIKVKVE